jgi:hypothetical protein
LENFNKDILTGIVAGYISCIQQGIKPNRTYKIVGRSFQLMPETVEKIVDRLLPKFLLGVLEKRNITLSYDERNILRSFLFSFLNNECCNRKALAETGIEHSISNLHDLEAKLRYILRKLILELGPLKQPSIPQI